MLPTTIINNSGNTGSGTGATADKPQVAPLLPGGQALMAIVKQVAAGTLGDQVFRIQVEADNRLLELATRAPLNPGDRVQISRTPGGELQLSLPPPPPAPGAPQQQPAVLILQAAASQLPQIRQSLPLNSPQTAQVHSSTPLPSASLGPGQGTAPHSVAAPPGTSPNAPDTSLRHTSAPPTPQHGTSRPPESSATSGSSATAPTPTRLATPPAGIQGQTYSAQLQQISQLGAVLNAGRSPAPAPAATPSTAIPANAPAANPASPVPGNVTPAPRPPASPVTTSGTPGPAHTDNAPARISQAGNHLLQALGQQQPRTPVQHQVQLQLANLSLQLLSPRPLQAGQQVTLTRVSDQQIHLQPMTPARPPEPPPASQAAMQHALREALPQQIPLGDALNQLLQLSQAPAVRGQSAIGQLVQSMLSLFSVTPGSADADQAIQRNLQQGGLFTESRLAHSQGGDKPPADLKQHLGQLLKLAEQLPPEPRQQMQRLVEALQARSTSQQISSLGAWKELPDGSQERVFRMDLPIRQEERQDTAELVISEHKRNSAQQGPTSFWSVALSFDLQQQGSMDVRLSLHEGWRLQLQFWTETETTLSRIEQQLEPLAQDLHRKGFIVDHIQARQGRPHQPQLNDIQHRLVDIHT
ncbi:flagellar hook-length control protein FliK [Marinobacterium marinum]|uniref:Flagellar hook-length control protein FliK n=1 Tax=Marinobacterium marinum TaxID=2756129 RepID=A0A7W1WW02_9GAMM|nr:flagellar hook-length control protein FliK [Marinobacterium marinum]MBA4501036.1 flagellar hook-length control protein FliK [Marinobacterium marinum]